MKPADFFTPDEQRLIEKAIADAESGTSGEIRIHTESTCAIDVLDRAAWMFAQLDMHKTALRNGVLIYLALNDKKFAVIGDAGINTRTGSNFWDEVKEAMRQEFAAGHMAEGLIAGVTMAGAKLKAFFPISADDTNELSNSISFGK